MAADPADVIVAVVIVQLYGMISIFEPILYYFCYFNYLVLTNFLINRRRIDGSQSEFEPQLEVVKDFEIVQHQVVCVAKRYFVFLLLFLRREKPLHSFRLLREL